jgi:hypothetical protein
MQSPVTREYLKNFDRKHYIAEKEKQQRYDFYAILIKSIFDELEKAMLNIAISDTKYVWKNIGILGHWRTFVNFRQYEAIQYYNNNLKQQNYDGIKDKNLIKFLPEFIDVLKQNFVGCDIIVDPLKTYLIIDWS